MVDNIIWVFLCLSGVRSFRQFNCFVHASMATHSDASREIGKASTSPRALWSTSFQVSIYMYLTFSAALHGMKETKSLLQGVYA